MTIAGRTVTVNQLAPSASPYDGRWVGSGRGTSSGSTPALLDVTLEVIDGFVRFDGTWRIDTAPGASVGFCNSSTSLALMRIVLGAFTLSTTNLTFVSYQYVVSGTFASTTSASGTLQVTPGTISSTAPWCLGATINWTATKR